MMQAIQTKKITCRFCGGKRTDPFNLLSSRSRCEVCKGTGEVTVPDPSVPCAFCRGAGSHKTFSCLVCKGTGRVPLLSGRTRKCPECEGRAYEISSGLECLRCHGRGVVLESAVLR